MPQTPIYDRIDNLTKMVASSIALAKNCTYAPNEVGQLLDAKYKARRLYELVTVACYEASKAPEVKAQDTMVEDDSQWDL
jgi:hypothetical protein